MVDSIRLKESIVLRRLLVVLCRQVDRELRLETRASSFMLKTAT